MNHKEAWESLIEWNEDMIKALKKRYENHPYDDYILMSLDVHNEFKKQMNIRIKQDKK